MFRSATLFLIRHSKCVLGMATVWAVLGLWVVLRTPMDAVPDLSENQVLVFADWAGQSPPEIERRVTRPLAMAFQGLPGVRTVRGSSDVGTALLHLIFENGVSFEDARQRVANRLAGMEIQFPDGVRPRMAADGIPTGQIFWYTVEGPSSDLATLRRLQDSIVAPQLRSVPGVAEVASVGGFVAEYQVEADLDRLSALGLTLVELETSLKAIIQPSMGQTLHTSNSEYLIRTVMPDSESSTNESQVLQKRLDLLRESSLPLPNGRSIRLGDVSSLSIGTAPRRGAFEKDGNEVVAGIVHLRYGFNPLEVTRNVRNRLQQIGDGLPDGVRLIPVYDRTPLILSAVETVTRTLFESLIVTSICVVLVLRHWRTSLVIVLTLPLVVLGAFLGMATLRISGIVDVQTNIMSLAGIVVSIGVLVDSSIVVAENVTHHLHLKFGNKPIVGDVSEIVADACSTVGVPAFLAVVMMLISFLPVFALQGIDGQMYRPLVWTKTLALLSAAILTVTLVPVLCAVMIRGRVYDESSSAIVRSVVGVYRPVLTYLMDHPTPLILMLCATLIAGAAATGIDLLVRSATVVCVVAIWWSITSSWNKGVLTVIGIVGALIAQSTMRPIGLALRLPLDEGMVMDMPITVPRVSISQAIDDLKQRNMVLCRFPEVRMVTGKAGRAETPFDPAPLDMIETMVEFQPRSHWPSRRMLRSDAEWAATLIIEELTTTGMIEKPANPGTLMTDVVEAGLIRFDAIQREVCWQRLQQFQTELSRELATLLVKDFVDRLWYQRALTQSITEHEIGSIVGELPSTDVSSLGKNVDVSTVHDLLGELRKRFFRRGWLRPESASEDQLLSGSTFMANLVRRMISLEPVKLEAELKSLLDSLGTRRWSQHRIQLDAELRKRAPPTWVQIVCSEVFAREPIVDEDLVAKWKQVLDARYASKLPTSHGSVSHAGIPSVSKLPAIDPHPRYDAIVDLMTRKLASRLWLWPHDNESLNRAGGEMDLAVQMPGWANVWTKPIQNRVDMLATGVSSEVGIRVMGRDLDTIVRVSDEIAEVLRGISGAADVVADPIRGKGYVLVIPNLQRAVDNGVSLADIDVVVSRAFTGQLVGSIDDGAAEHGLRLKVQGPNTDSYESLRQMPIPCRSLMLGQNNVDEMNESSNRFATVPLADVAEIRTVDGPATIKSENGFLRNYVRLNVRDRDPAKFVAAAQQHLRQSVQLPEGIFVEWTGQFEHAMKTRRMMLWMVPVVLMLILSILYAAFRDVADAGLMLLSVPGALAGGVLCQWVLGFPFSVAVGIGYIACFGMAAATSMVMLVYLREAVKNGGGMESMSLTELRTAVIVGAVHRLRPKLLTEATTILSLAPMLWSTGMGADVIRPMAAPVLGGILIADEVVDLLLPIAFYAVRRRRWQQLSVAREK